MKLKISNYNAKSKKKILSYELVKKIKKKFKVYKNVHIGY